MFNFESIKNQNNGKIKSGILGGFSGTVGPVVGFSWKGKACMRSKALSVHDANTEEQRKWRSRFTTISHLIPQVLPFIQFGFKGQAKEMTEGNVMMKRNVTSVFTGSYPNETIDWSKLVVAAGSLDLPFNAAVTLTNTDLSFSWVNNAGLGNAAADDSVNLLIYNPTKRQCVSLLSVATRADGTYTYAFPTLWTNNDVEIYLAMGSADGSKTSNSLYLGKISL